MGGLRQILMQRRQLALWLVALALAMKALVPGGFMVREQGTVLTIAICGDVAGAHLSRQIVVPQREAPQDLASQHAKGAACPYSALDMSGTAATDPILLGLALAFILAIGLAPLVASEPSVHAHLRPPLRGPPLIA
jgi:hypothetical protein